MIEPSLLSVAENTCDATHLLRKAGSWIQSIFHHDEINEYEKQLWIWLVIHSVPSQDNSCCFSYQQLADVMQRGVDSIHRGLLRLRLMGFLLSELPFLHGVVTNESAQVRRMLTPTLPEIEEKKKRDITINLIRNQLKGGKYVGIR